ncbi:transcriptional regulator [Cellulomonas sp. WB94]|uniref:substrate-binding domain-containing protein n=1 Tax=Cellulomonas sp. WB94 TaxID=2173174 RepID=UPI000D5757F6|nr:substrate-binding domain-containing protein [Cellulomonas sp. WB94]PVU82254.1 transcriptional regulator [Cellulomonas sp. WB94]
MSVPDARSPLAIARRSQILDALQREGTVRVSELTDQLGVTVNTIRRDIAQLAAEGLVHRVHGGATAVSASDEADGDAAPRRRGASTAVRTVGMLVPSLDYYWPDVVRGAEEAASEDNLRVALRGSSYETEDDRPQLEWLVDQLRVDGLAVAPRMDNSTARATVEWLATLDIPVVLVERTANVGPHHEVMESVVSDHVLGSAMAVRHLAALGHRCVGLVTSAQSPTSPKVRQGWLEGIADCGLAGSAQTIDANVPSPGSAECDAALDAILDDCLRTGTTALVVHADSEAMALVQHCEARGIRVPHDLSVVAYDDALAGLFSPALTAVRPPRRSVGRAAIDLVAARLADPRRPAHRVVISPSLRVRDSTAPPPTLS